MPKTIRQPMDATKWKKLMAGRRRKGLCNCWDCLRGDGITPPRSVLSKHGRRVGHLPANPYVHKKGTRVIVREQMVKDKNTGEQKFEREMTVAT